MQLRGYSPDGTPAVSYVGTPTGSIIGSAPMPIDKIITATGQPGGPGPANVLSIGTVTGGDTASADITGTSPSQVLDLVLPKGDKGDPGPQGDTGPAGASDWSDLTNVPATFPPSPHTHAESDITGLATDLAAKENTANRGVANGYAPLDSGSLVPAAYLPSYVDDVLEYSALTAFPATGESGKIYVADDTRKIYRWSGSAYIEISPSPGSTDAVPEGATNLYYTDSRVATKVAAMVGTTSGTIAAGDDPRFSGATPVSRTLSWSNGGQGGQKAQYVSGTATTISITNCSIRIPFRLPANTTQWRVKLRNYDGGTPATQTGVTLDKIIVGKATTPSLAAVGPTGNFLGSTATTVVSTTQTIPGDGTYYTSPWITASGDQVQDGVDWLLGIAFHAASALTMQTGIGMCWRWTDNTSGVNPATASSGAASTASWIPIDFVIEYQTTNTKKALLVIGDSIPEGSQGPSYAIASTSGARTDIVPTPIYSRYFDRWAARRGDYMVQSHCLYGGFAQTWASSSYTGWTRQDTTNGNFTAVVIAIGCNDIANGRTLAQIQADWTSCITNIRSLVGTSVPIYVTNFTPYYTYTTANETIRKQINSWFSQLPYGVVGVIDFDSEMRVLGSSQGLTTTAAIDSQLTSDGTHPSYQGTSKLVDVLMAAIP